MELASLKLTEPIEVGGAPKDTIVVRHTYKVRDSAAVQRYARRIGLAATDFARLLSEQDFGAWCALIDSMCELGEGSAEQLNHTDFASAMEMIGPFLK